MNSASIATIFRTVRATILFALVGLLIACWLLSDDDFTRQSHTVIVNGETRHFWLTVPEVAATEKLPLVFAFHGAGGGAQGLIRSSQFDEVASRHRVIVVYPEAIRGLWAVPGTAPPERIDDDLRFIDRMIEQLSQSHRIDRERIYAIGMSHGASFAQHLASSRSTMLAAVVAHSHPPPSTIWESAPARYVPTMLIIGTKDQQASPAKVEQAAEQYAARGQETELIVLPDWGHQWDRRLNDTMIEFLLAHRSSATERQEPTQ